MATATDDNAADEKSDKSIWQLLNIRCTGYRMEIFMKTEVTKLLGIEYPIIQGGMAWVAEYHLAAAVSEAGGLGLIGAASAPAEWVRQQVQEVKKLTD